MKLLTEHKESSGELYLCGALDIYSAESFHSALSQYVSAAGPVVALDLAGVEACDFTGVQLLCSAKRTAVDRGKGFRADHIPPAVIECCDLLGIPSDALQSLSLS